MSRLLIRNEIIVDSFAGGGGASLGIEMALGRSPDIAINHDAEALAMHMANHPATTHYCEDVWRVDPVKACKGRPVGLMWLSPDCKHFSKAKGAKPVEKRIRGLAWVAAHWARTVRPRVIILENVEEFQEWGPLGEDGRPCPLRKGLTFKRFVGRLRNLGYEVDWDELKACDYGVPTSRRRLFLIARCDGYPIVWPKPTHGPGLLPYRTAAECIDWSIPCPSIFERKRPLAENTQRRIAAGIKRYVIDCADPFIVPVTHQGDARVYGIDEPMRTITGAHRGELALVAPYLVPRYGEREGKAPRTISIEQPVPTIVPTGNHGHLVTAFLAKHYGGVVGQVLNKSIGTVTAVDHHSLVASNIVKLRGTSTAQASDKPLHTISAQGNHFAEVRAFLIKFYSEGGQWAACNEPMHTIPTKDRMGLVTIRGEDYAIVDIGMRMLQPRELFAAQGFPPSYVIDLEVNGKPLTKEAQVRMVGNSVCPPLACAIVAANFGQQLAQLRLVA